MQADILGPGCFLMMVNNDPNNQHQLMPKHEVFVFKFLKNLKQGVLNNGAQGPFALGILVIKGYHLAPNDGRYLNPSCLSPSQYLHFSVPL